jgi:tetratricopeptide (TPR) repeat protein
MPRTLIRSAAVLLLAGFLAPVAAGQEDTSKSAVADVYRMSQESKSIEDFDKMIEECLRLQDAGLSQAHADYVKQLTSWALNKRGELRSDAAIAKADAGEAEAAAQLDAQALEDFNASLKLDPSRWKAYHNRGVSYAMAAEYDKALAEFDQALRLKPTYANSWFNRGEIHYEQGKFPEAISDYNNSLRASPDDADAYTRRGHAYFKLGRYREALRDYTRTVELKRDDPLAYLNRGEAYLSLGMWPQASQDYRQSITLDANLGRAYQGAAWLMATCPDPRFRLPDRAIAAAQKAIELSGAEADYRYYDTLAAAHAAAGDFPKALETIAQAITMAPSDKTADLQRRQTMYQQNRAYRIPS